MKTMFRRWKRQHTDPQGMTSIEVLAAIVILGILTAVLVSRSDLSVDVSVVAEAEALKSQLRFAQNRAMNSGDSWGVTCSGDTYRLFRYTSGSRTYVTMPGVGANSMDLGAIGYSVGSFTVSYDDWGRPCSGDTGVTALGSNMSITVSKGSKSETITITKNTGFIA